MCGERTSSCTANKKQRLHWFTGKKKFALWRHEYSLVHPKCAVIQLCTMKHLPLPWHPTSLVQGWLSLAVKFACIPQSRRVYCVRCRSQSSFFVWSASPWGVWRVSLLKSCSTVFHCKLWAGEVLWTANTLSTLLELKEFRRFRTS